MRCTAEAKLQLRVFGSTYNCQADHGLVASVPEIPHIDVDNELEKCARPKMWGDSPLKESSTFPVGHVKFGKVHGCPKQNSCTMPNLESA